MPYANTKLVNINKLVKKLVKKLVNKLKIRKLFDRLIIYLQIT